MEPRQTWQKQQVLPDLIQLMVMNGTVARGEGALRTRGETCGKDGRIVDLIEWSVVARFRKMGGCWCQKSALNTGCAPLLPTNRPRTKPCFSVAVCYLRFSGSFAALSPHAILMFRTYPFMPTIPD